MDYDVDIVQLSKKFSVDYPQNKYPELMLKQGRPYSCLIIETHYGFFICIPFRSSILHNNAFIFKGSARSKKSRSGLDYSKIILIKDLDYIDNNNAVVDKDEYNETIANIPQIVRKVSKYIDDYVNHINGTRVLHTREFDRKYKYSTLSYFHDILEI
ncbi:MAG: hypothetical protein II388_06215 [Clostridia bacterium]|nr:hypothetical protein [Clostridia bacterium]